MNTTANTTKGQLVVQQVTRDRKTAARFVVRGNVGKENRAKLDALGMTPVIGISNCREKLVYNQADAVALRDALVAQEIV